MVKPKNKIILGLFIYNTNSSKLSLVNDDYKTFSISPEYVFRVT
ncbi:hypothetical protein [Winogradskyella sp. 4-2091]